MEIYAGGVKAAEQFGIFVGNIEGIVGITATCESYHHIINIKPFKSENLVGRGYLNTDNGMGSKTLTSRSNGGTAAVAKHNPMHFKFLNKVNIILNHQKCIALTALRHDGLGYVAKTRLAVACSLLCELNPAASAFYGHVNLLFNRIAV